MISRRIITTVAAVALASCYDSDFSLSETDTTPPAATTTIAALCCDFAGEATTITGDIVVEGRVTSSGKAQNFYRTLLIGDQGAALELMAGIDHLANSYPEGSRVSLRLKGLTLARSRGVMQAGYAPEAGSGYATSYIPSRAALDHHLFLHDSPATHNVPTPCTITGLIPSMCGTLVRIERLTLLPDPEELTAPTWAGERVFADPDGNRIKTFVRNYARFADYKIPDREGAVTGILYLSGESYQLKPRHEDDFEF